MPDEVVSSAEIEIVRVDDGATGATGATGPQGPKGDPGLTVAEIEAIIDDTIADYLGRTY